MKKKTFEWRGKKYYLLGEDADGDRFYLEEAHWDCGWYWGGGYVETFTNNRFPENSKDISSHMHFDGLFFKQPRKNGYDAFKEFFAETPFTDSEVWEILELMKSFYIARGYSDFLYLCGAHYTSNPCGVVIKNEEEYDRINKVVIPSLMEELYKILEEEN